MSGVVGAATARPPCRVAAIKGDVGLRVPGPTLAPWFGVSTLRRKPRHTRRHHREDGQGRQ
eukprot:scaffold28332_cov31-Tisochrysis_lutea.AAC.9